jgi:hypothetical protein
MWIRGTFRSPLSPPRQGMHSSPWQATGQPAKVFVYRKIEDVIEGRDAQLERIVELIETTRGRG